MIVAIIPAHNEAQIIQGTIASLLHQTHSPDRILVVSDNSTDNTVEIARAAGADVMESVDNTHRKAGALNQALEVVAAMNPRHVMVMDADTQLAPRFIEIALERLRDPKMGAVGAVFGGVDPEGYLQYMQRLEWARYAEQIERTDQTFVLSGTAALIRWDAMEAVKDHFGRYYDLGSITEDMRLTQDLKTVGYRLCSPVECESTTEMMPSVKLLFLQRRRWYLGALQKVTAYGFTRVSAPYWRQQLMLCLSVGLMSLYLTLTALSLVFGWFALNPFWLAVGAVFAVERTVTVWKLGWKARFTAVLVFPELIYALILQSAFVAAVHQHLTGQTGSWHHVEVEEGTPVNV